MGKSDPYIFAEYRQILDGVMSDATAFLGFDGENAFTASVPGSIRDFYDIRLGGAGSWDINSEWSLKRKYDLIVSTRCPYFSRNPRDFIDRCDAHLNVGGRIMLDFGLGDHWRFDAFKVGWVRNGEHEWAYDKRNTLHSCLWRHEFVMQPEVQAFVKSIAGRFGYPDAPDIDKIICDEVPALVDYDYERIRFKMLWPTTPQLYIITLGHPKR